MEEKFIHQNIFSGFVTKFDLKNFAMRQLKEKLSKSISCKAIKKCQNEIMCTCHYKFGLRRVIKFGDTILPFLVLIIWTKYELLLIKRQRSCGQFKMMIWHCYLWQ